MKPNFSGYVSKANLECADGRTIKPGAFAHQDGLDVPLVYQHNHDDINQVLGHVVLKDKEDGLWGDVYLNDTASAKNADALVKHGDLKKFSIWAKNLVERGLDVLRGDVQEVSLVLAGANSGANIANYQNVLAHSGMDEDDVLLIVGGEIQHADTDSDEKETVDSDKESEDGATVGDVLETLTDDQRTAVNAVIDATVTEAVTDAVTEALAEEPNLTHDNIDSSKKGTKMSRNVFDRSKQQEAQRDLPQLKHDDVRAVLTRAKGPSGEGGDNASTSLRQLVRSDQGRELMHADTYGIDNIEVLFPEAQALMRTPTFVDRRQDWVKKVLAGVSKSPFSRVKTVYADITADEARAKGYIKGHEKTEEVFPVFKRTTGPTWVIKKQKLDRQDIIDIVDFDVVAWMKAEMRGKLDEELARAAIFGDGRPTMVGGELNPDKIKDPGGANTSGDGIRAVIADNALYTSTVNVPMAPAPGNDDWNRLIDTVTEEREGYLGSGNLTALLSYRTASKLLTIRDAFGHRVYKNLSEVAGDLDVNEIIRIPTELFEDDTLMIVLDLADYNFGANRGGEVTLFDDFDIDFNQYKYLIETYLSGALTLPYSAQVYKSVESTNVSVTPTEPAFAANVITIPVQTGVLYKRSDNGNTVSPGSTIALNESPLDALTITAHAQPGYTIPSGSTTSWDFVYDA